jgi:serine/threonine protein kinase
MQRLVLGKYEFNSTDPEFDHIWYNDQYVAKTYDDVESIDVYDKIKKLIPNPKYIVLPIKKYIIKDNGYLIYNRYIASLDNYIKNNTLSDQDKYQLSKQVFECIKELHDHNIAHCDIKPRNFVLETINPLKLRLIDLDFAIFEPCDDTDCGTMAYRGIELLLNKSYYKPVDIWAAAVTVYEIYNKKDLFDIWSYANDDMSDAIIDMLLLRRMQYMLGELPDDLKQTVIHLYSDHAIVNNTTAKLTDYNLLSCLDYDPNNRPTVDDVIKLNYN